MPSTALILQLWDIPQPHRHRETQVGDLHVARRQNVVARTWVLDLGQVVFRSQMYKLHQIPNLSDPQVTHLYNGNDSINPQAVISSSEI